MSSGTKFFPETCDDVLGDVVSPEIRSQIRAVLARHPEGITSDQLKQMYKEMYKVDLPLAELGCDTMLQLARHLSAVVTLRHTVGQSDWLLFDSNRNSPSQNLQAPCSQQNSLVEEVQERPVAHADKLVQCIRQFKKGLAYEDVGQEFKKFTGEELQISPHTTLENILAGMRPDVELQYSYTGLRVLPGSKKRQSCAPTVRNTREEPQRQVRYVPPDVVAIGNKFVYETLPGSQTPDDLVIVDIQVVEYKSPYVMYFHIKGCPKFEEMMNRMGQFYEGPDSNKYIMHECQIVVGRICAVPYKGVWHRGVITSKKGDSIGIRYVDYGTKGFVHSGKEIRLLRQEYFTLPAQGIQARLCGIKPTEEKWQQGPSQFLWDYVDRPLQLKACNIYNNSERRAADVVLLDVTGGSLICLNELMIDMGLAKEIPEWRPVFDQTKAAVSAGQPAPAVQASSPDMKPQQPTLALNSRNSASPTPACSTSTSPSLNPAQPEMLPWTHMVKKVSHSIAIATKTPCGASISDQAVPYLSPDPSVALNGWAGLPAGQHGGVHAESAASRSMFYHEPRYVKTFLLPSGKSIHMINVNDAAYVTGAEISALFVEWGGRDLLEEMMKKQGVDVPCMPVSRSENPVLFRQMHRMMVPGSFHVATEGITDMVMLYSMWYVGEILTHLNHPSAEVIKAMENISETFNHLDGYWMGY